MEGLLYVVYNEWIINPKTGKMPYKIGITTKTVDARYYGLGLKMPGTFKALFAYKFNDCARAENVIRGLFEQYCVNGEWFEINEDQIELVKKNCENMGGIPTTDETQEEILEDSEKDYSLPRRKKERDRSRYKINGMEQTYGKSPLVKEVIKSYITKNPDVTLKELQKMFPKKTQGSVGVIDTRENARNRYRNERHYTTENDIITLKTGEKIVICHEWGISNIGNFIEKAKELGFDITKQESN